MSVFIAIDLKSFYASVECVERHLDPLTTNLVVADASRTEKTICLAVTPPLKAKGIPGRPRLFEVIEQVGKINAERRAAFGKPLCGESFDAPTLEKHPENALSYITATPRMSLYMRYSTKIFGIYLKYVAPEDIHVYSVDEVFMDVTGYLKTYRMTPERLAMTMIRDVLAQTGITATAGIGTNLYLAKVAMDIVAKHCQPDENGVRMASLDEFSYRKSLWDHQPLTDFWRVGPGTTAALAKVGIRTMGEIALCSVGEESDFYNENLLYKLFGVNAELLIDHAWGYEPCTMEQIKSYRPRSSAVSTGQVLSRPYAFEEARLVVREMADSLALDLTERGVCTEKIELLIGYEALTGRENYRGATGLDYLGRTVPKHAVGCEKLPLRSASCRWIAEAAVRIFERTVDPVLNVRRINISASPVYRVSDGLPPPAEQLDFFAPDAGAERRAQSDFLRRESERQKAILKLRTRYGKNAILKAVSLEEGATMPQRNAQIGGHRA